MSKLRKEKSSCLKLYGVYTKSEFIDMMKSL